MRSLEIRSEVWPLRSVFRISRGSRTEVPVVVVEIREGDFAGRGECGPIRRYGEDSAQTGTIVESIRSRLLAGMTRAELQRALPPGAARNAVDCALWDLEAKSSGQPAWRLAGLAAEPTPVVTAVTISYDTPETMGEAAARLQDSPLLKIKLGGAGDVARVEAVRKAAPRARLIVDANEGWNLEQCHEFIPALAQLGVEMIEQPLPAGKDEGLREVARTVPICADESCHTRADLPGLAGLYDFVNIKLDKTGGLTGALELAAAAEQAGFRIMVGTMVGTSLAMAPGMLLTGKAEFVDLDGPLLLVKDRERGLRFEGGKVFPPEPALWG